MTLCLALGLAAALGYPPESVGTKACACGHAGEPKSTGALPPMPCGPCVAGCLFCASTGTLSLPDAEGFWVRPTVAPRAGDLVPTPEARRYPPPLPPPRPWADPRPCIA
jgi:hypothetical protein